VNEEHAVRLRRAISRLSRRFNASSTDELLTPTEASVLADIAVFGGPCGISDIVASQQINRTMLSRVVSRLVSLGAIVRTADKGNLRAARLEVTPLGMQIHERIRRQRAEAVSQAADRLSASQRTRLLDALSALEDLATELESASNQTNP